MKQINYSEKEIKERVRSPQNKLKNLQEKELPSRKSCRFIDLPDRITDCFNGTLDRLNKESLTNWPLLQLERLSYVKVWFTAKVVAQIYFK